MSKPTDKVNELHVLQAHAAPRVWASTYEPDEATSLEALRLR